MDTSAEEILFLVLVLTVLAVFSGWIATWVFRVAARQRIAENLLRERLARMWSATPRSAGPESR